jgi:hypothetical protein
MIDLLIALGRYAAATRAVIEGNIADHRADVPKSPEAEARGAEMMAALDAVPERRRWLADMVLSRIVRQTGYWREMES